VNLGIDLLYVLRGFRAADWARGRIALNIAHRVATGAAIANRQIDPWEIACVQAYPAKRPGDIALLEASLFAKFNAKKPLMNGSVPVAKEPLLKKLLEPAQVIQVMPDEEIKVRKDPALRLPRQIEHIGRLVDHILTVKDSRQLRRSLAAHFERLDEYRQAFLTAGTSVTRPAGEEEEEEE
jgi:hypothetical protein